MYQTMKNDTITVGALAVRFLVEAADSNATASVFECYVPANSRMPAPHSHDGFEETIYGLKGVTTWTIDGETVEIGPGEAVCVPRGQIHGFENHGTDDAKFLAIATTAVFGDGRRPPGSHGDRRSDAPPRPHPRPSERCLTAGSLPPPAHREALHGRGDG